MLGLSQRLQRALDGRYIVERPLGKGGMATVFLARDPKHHRLVAIKVLDPEVAASIGEDRFRREIETVANLTHPHILTLHDSGVADGLLYYVTPYVEGESLRQRLDRDGPLRPVEALHLAAELADALGYAHRHGVVHRDIKPGNILLEEGHALLADFGIARIDPGRRVDTRAETGASAPHTTTGVIVGTPTYMSPEQISGSRDLDGRSDQYALGCVLFEMLTGAPPFAGPSSAALIRGHLATPPPRLTTLRAGIVPPVERAIQRALAKEPSDRFPDAEAFAAELRRLERVQPDVSMERRPLRRVRLVHVLAGAFVIAVIALASGSILPGWLSGSRAEPISTIAVLPLADLEDGPATGYLADGLTGEIGAALAREGTLSVIANASVGGFRGPERDYPRIGRELGADALVTGAVLHAGSRIRLSVALVRSTTGREIWSREFMAADRDLRALPQEVARAVTHAAGRRREGKRTGGAVGSGPLSPAAHEAFLRGQHHWNERTAEGLRAARDDYSRATSLDSGYARAWVGLADTYCLMPLYDTVGVDEAMPLARAAALRALSLDSTLAEAHASLGHIEKTWTFDWNAAEEHYRRAIALNPNYATAHHWYAVLLVWGGHLEEGLSEIEAASRLDPLSPMIQLTLARICYLRRDYPRAAREYQRTIELDPSRASAWRGLSGVYVRQGRVREASAAWEMSLALLADSLHAAPAPPARTAEALLARRVASMRLLARHDIVTPAELAAVLAEAGLRDEAFGLLQRARMDELVLGDLRALPEYDSLRAEPRFRLLEEQVRLRQSRVRGTRATLAGA